LESKRRLSIYDEYGWVFRSKAQELWDWAQIRTLSNQQLLLEAQQHKKYAQTTPLDDGVSSLYYYLFFYKILNLFWNFFLVKKSKYWKLCLFRYTIRWIEFFGEVSHKNLEYIFFQRSDFLRTPPKWQSIKERISDNWKQKQILGKQTSNPFTFTFSYRLNKEQCEFKNILHRDFFKGRKKNNGREFFKVPA
jgi:hypothetical protein